MDTQYWGFPKMSPFSNLVEITQHKSSFRISTSTYVNRNWMFRILGQWFRPNLLPNRRYKSKWRSSANVVASRRFEKENAYHPVDVRRSKTPYIAESVPPKTTTLEGYNGAQWFQNWAITLRFSLPRTFSFSAFYCNSIASMKDVKVLHT